MPDSLTSRPGDPHPLGRHRHRSAGGRAGDRLRFLQRRFGLDETQTPGLYRLVAEIGGKPYGGEFRVRDYVKPTFYLELIDRSPTVVPGERFFVKFRAKRYSGGVPRG